LLLFVEIAVVIACLAVVATGVAAIATLASIRKATAQVSALTAEARETLASAREVIPPVRRVVDRFEALAGRTADLSTSVLEDLAPPILTAVAAVRGVRSFTAYFMKRLSHRFTHGRSAANGESDDE
jgi:uncharacterized protein YoxC